MLNYLIHNTDLSEFLTQYELTQLRGTSLVLKNFIDKIIYPRGYTWVQKCRFCNPDILWEINHHHEGISCYKPRRKKWVMMYWKKKLPSIIPPKFWNYFESFVRGYMTLSKFEQWHSFHKEMLWFPHHVLKFKIPCHRWKYWK